MKEITSRTQFRRKLGKYIYWNTKPDGTEKDYRDTINKWIANHKGALDFYMERPEFWYTYFKGAMQGRKEDLIQKQNNKPS